MVSNEGQGRGIPTPSGLLLFHEEDHPGDLGNLTHIALFHKWSDGRAMDIKMRGLRFNPHLEYSLIPRKFGCVARPSNDTRTTVLRKYANTS